MSLGLFILALALPQEPAGTPEQLTQYRISRLLGQPEKIDTELEQAARTSSLFGARYAALLVRVRRSLESGRGLEAQWMDIAQASTAGAPPGAADHLRALARSFKEAVYCKDCKNGRIEDPKCKGKRTVDLPCAACAGKGEVPASGTVGKAKVMVRCNACNRAGVFKNRSCPDCDKGGTVACGSCLGRPWHDRSCENKECRAGRVRCGTCKGRAKVAVTCTDCEGKGRTRAVGAVGGANVTVKCRGCDGVGVLKEEAPCPACSTGASGLGLAACPDCTKGEAPKPRAALSSVYSTEPCAPCKGAGWPTPGQAAACPKCLGLGVRIKPGADPAKMLD